MSVVYGTKINEKTDKNTQKTQTTKLNKVEQQQPCFSSRLKKLTKKWTRPHLNQKKLLSLRLQCIRLTIGKIMQICKQLIE